MKRSEMWPDRPDYPVACFEVALRRDVVNYRMYFIDHRGRKLWEGQSHLVQIGWFCVMGEIDE